LTGSKNNQKQILAKIEIRQKTMRFQHFVRSFLTFQFFGKKYRIFGGMFSAVIVICRV
jgi:hypothetical protein